jgi:dephospho-CoA kinase
LVLDLDVVKVNVMKKAIVVCGPISSGKSSVIKSLSNKYGWDIISFGAFVKKRADILGLSSTRQSLQDLGYELFSSLGPAVFLQEVIDYHQAQSAVQLIDGVRDSSIVTELRKVYSDVFVAYLDVSDGVRYERYKARLTRPEAPLAYDEFLAVSQQPIEMGTSGLAPVAGLVVDASQPLPSIVDEIESGLIARSFVDPQS